MAELGRIDELALQRLAAGALEVTQMLALAHRLEGAIDRRLSTDRLMRARVTQLLDLLMLAPDLQVAVLALEAVDSAEPMDERTLRAVAHAGTWADQRAAC
ncbi:uncharacterized protein SOCE26_011350 [Sorangium cellulosum]|uniref:Uncharacterized protein n=1 Tax=Sorangium cellulosum TaxID=56 RepID=A0A2L0EKB7_SORCE|nr:hypothetical protein [Sorangium cellulosum]AUX39740.1 uncharacterized protein SOCE26_011350 [Sorangium cellulosum]